jgi:hypothetical protein
VEYGSPLGHNPKRVLVFQRTIGGCIMNTDTGQLYSQKFYIFRFISRIITLKYDKINALETSEKAG